MTTKIGFIKYKTKVIRTCDQCGCEFETYFRTEKRCSQKCKNKYRAKFEQNRRDKNKIVKKRYANCVICGKEFELAPKSSANTCSDECRKIRASHMAKKRWREKPEQYKGYDKKFRMSEKYKKYKEENKDRIRKRVNEYSKRHKKQNVEYKLKCAIQRSLLRYLGQTGETKRIKDYVDYSALDLKQHLESKFQEGMNWNNHGLKGWHIDHIMPVSSFKFYDDNGIINVEAVKKCLSLDNLQPLWWRDNLVKSNKILT